MMEEMITGDEEVKKLKHLGDMSQTSHPGSYQDFMGTDTEETRQARLQWISVFEVSQNDAFGMAKVGFTCDLF